ncbi:unnamed protein product [Caenorhabditis brenneri]
MSLSRPATFPLLKLPWLCIKCVLHNSNEFILLYFATISARTRRIVKNSSYPLKEIEVDLGERSRIRMKDQLGKTENEKSWYFIHDNNANGSKLSLERNSQPFRTIEYLDCWEDHHLHSYTTGDKLDALKLCMEFMIDVFGCTIRHVSVPGNKLSELVRLGISSVEKLYISYADPVNITDLRLLLENIEVTDKYIFCAPIPANFSCDPQIFKCQELVFWLDSAAWITREILLQLEVPRLKFEKCPFSVEDILSFVIQWFHSDNKKLEYLHIESCGQISLEKFLTVDLNPLLFSGRTRVPPTFGVFDLSKGLEIVRHDGLKATFHVKGWDFLFYIWHNQ